MGRRIADPAPTARPLARALAWVLTLGLGLGLASGCRPKELAHPVDEARLLSASAILPEADRLRFALVNNRVAEIHDWLSQNLRSQLRTSDISAVALRLRRDYGQPLGILEERIHREGDLVWYSGLVVHAHGRPGSPDRRRRQRLVLYQFALKGDLLDRLLIREHQDIRHLESPARRYTLVTRVHFLSTGEWTMTHGGKRRGTNYHHGSRSQRYAYDMVVQKAGRQRGSDNGSNRDYYCYGLPIFAPAAGTIVQAINDVPENRPGETGRAGGNGVVIDHGFGEHSSIWHMIPGTVTVKVGDKVELGQQIGQVGNSGRSSGPHIHYQVSSAISDGPTNIGLQAPFVDVYVDGQWYPRAMPVRGQRVRGTATPSTKARSGVLIDASM